MSKIQIYCDGIDRSPHRSKKLALFIRDEDLMMIWRPAVYRQQVVQYLAGDRLLAGAEEYSQALGEDTLAAGGLADEADSRLRFDITCPSCRLRLQIEQLKFDSALDSIEQDGVSQIRFKTLVSILSK